MLISGPSIKDSPFVRSLFQFFSNGLNFIVKLFSQEAFWMFKHVCLLLLHWNHILAG